MLESWEQLQEYIQQIKSENEDLLEQVAILTSQVDHYEDQYR